MAKGKKPTKRKADPEEWKFSAEERERVTQNFSYDVKSSGRLSNGDDWSILVQSHLYLDHVISKILEEEFKHPENIDIDRIAFAAKIDLCAALGLIDTQVKGLLRYVNSVRNKLAHDLNFKIPADVSTRLYELSADHEKALMDDRRELWPTEPVLYQYLTTILVTLDIRRQWLADMRANRADALEHARELLERLQRAPSSAGK